MPDARHDLDLTGEPWPAAVIRDLPVGLLEMDAGGRVVRANRALVRLLQPVAPVEISTSEGGPPVGGDRGVQGRLVTECWPRLAESAVTVLSGRAVEATVRCGHADLRVSGVPRWLASRPHGGLLVVAAVASDRGLVVDLRDGPGEGDFHPAADLAASPTASATASAAGTSAAGETARPTGAAWRRMTSGRRRQTSGRGDEHAATHDPVTGLPNQVLLLQCLADALTSCRFGRRVAVLAVHVAPDGRRSDDDVSRDVAERLSQLVGPSDVAARVDGGRFAAVLRDLRPGADVERFLTRAERHLGGASHDSSSAVRIDGLGIVLADPATGAPTERDPRLVLALALEATERSRAVGCPVVGTEPPAEAERARLQALSSYDLYDGTLDDALQGIAQVASVTCGCPAALVTFVDADLQWVRAASGDHVVPFVDARAPRHLALCDRTIRGRDVLVVPDTEADSAYRVSRHVGWQVGMRFYAGAPLVTCEGRAIGTLCVLDRRPRDLGERQRRSLAVLAGETVALLEAHRYR